MCKVVASVKVKPSKLAKVTQTTDKKCRVIGKCVQCKRKQKLVSKLKDELQTCYKDIDRLQQEIEETTNTIDLKTVILDELSKRVKELVHDNCELSASNERLHQDQAERLDALSRHNTRLVGRATWATAKVGRLQEDNTRLRGEQEDLQLQARMMDSDIQALRQRLNHKETEYSSVRNHQSALSQLSDDLLYTLSVHGCTTLRDRNGNKINLRKVEGKQLQIDGWKVVTSKRTGKMVASLAAQEARIWNLKNSNNSLTSQIAAMTATIDDKLAAAKSLESEKESLSQELAAIKACLPPDTQDRATQLYTHPPDTQPRTQPSDSHTDTRPIRKPLTQKRHKKQKVTEEQSPVIKAAWPEQPQSRAAAAAAAVVPKCKSASNPRISTTPTNTGSTSSLRATHPKTSAPKFVTDIATAFSNLKSMCSKLTSSLQHKPAGRRQPARYGDLELEDLEGPTASYLRDVPSALSAIHNLYPSTSNITAHSYDDQGSLLRDTPSDTRSPHRREHPGKSLEGCPSGLSDVHRLYPSTTRLPHGPTPPRQASLHSVPSGKLRLSASELSRRLSELDSELENLLKDVPSACDDIGGLYREQEDQPLLGRTPSQEGHGLAPRRSSHSRHLLRDVPSALADIQHLYETSAENEPCSQRPYCNRCADEECDPVYRRSPNWFYPDPLHRFRQPQCPERWPLHTDQPPMLRPLPAMYPPCHYARGTAMDQWSTPDHDLANFWSDRIRRRLDDSFAQDSHQRFEQRFTDNQNTEESQQGRKNSGSKDIFYGPEQQQQDTKANKQKRKAKKSKKGKNSHKKRGMVWMHL